MKKIIKVCLVTMFVLIGASSVFADALTGTRWQWTTSRTSAGTTSVDKPANYTVEFQSGGKVSVKADCNNGFGTYTVKGSSLIFGPIGTTRMLCPDGSLDGKFLLGLQAARFYRVTGNTMTVQLATGGDVLTFTRATGNPLAGTKWQWTSTQTPKETFTPTGPSSYTLEFQEGTVTVQADCNSGSGKYTVKNNAIRLGPIAMSMRACIGESLESRFLKQISVARLFEINGDKMRIDLFADSGNMHFSKIGASSANPLKETSWNWVSTRTGGTTVTVGEPKNHNLLFMTENTVSAQLDCNRGNGGYTVDGNKITIGPMASTMMACEGASGSTFGFQLAKAQNFRIDGDKLTIELADGAGTMNFVRALSWKLP